jgi:hypothetical protein
VEKDTLAMLIRFARRMPAGTAFSGYTAAWLHGLDVAPCNPIEVTIPKTLASPAAPAGQFDAPVWLLARS